MPVPWRLLAYGALLLGGLLLLTALGVVLVTGQAGRPVQLLLLWGGALVAAFAILEAEAFTRFLRTQGVRGGGTVLVRSLAVAGILVLVGVVVSRHPLTKDLTTTSVNSLSPQTVKILHGLSDRIEVTAYFTSQAPGRRQAQDLLNLYARESRQFVLTFVDPEVHLDQAVRAEVQRDGTTVFVRGNQQPERVTSATEQDFTTALIKLTRAEKPKVYFLTGHGERTLDPGDRRALGAARDALTRQAYATDELLLVGNQTAVPPDAAVVIVAAPRTPIPEPEVKALQDWMDKGGHLMVLGIPFSASNLNTLLAPYGLSIDRGFVIDQDRFYPLRPQILLSARYPDHLITRELQNQLTVMPQVAPVVRQGQPKGSLTSLWDTSSNSWEKTNQNATDPSFDARQDKRGPFSLLQVGEIPVAGGTSAGRLAVVGTADFADNEWFQFEGIVNVALFTNVVNWLAGEEHLISIPPKNVRSVSARLPQLDANLVFFGTTLFMPALILLVGVLVWVRRQMRL